MKKVIALILALVMVSMLFAVDPVVNATEAADSPFYAVNFQAITVDSPYLYELISIYTPAITDLSSYRVPDYKGIINIDLIAEEMKKDMDARPEGTRYILFDMLRSTVGIADNMLFLDTGIEMTKQWLTSFLAAYKRIGGKLDGILVDLEYTSIECYDIWLDIYRDTNPDIYSDIVSDARYATRIRPLLEKYGFKFWPDNSKPEIWGMNIDVIDSNSQYEICRTAWDNMVNELLADAINKSTFEPLMQYYPDAVLSDYQRGDFDGWMKGVTDGGTVRLGNISKAGNASNYNIYSNRVHNSVYTSYANIPGYNGAIYGSDPFYMTMWDTNLFKTMLAGTDSGNINAWIGGYTGYWAYYGGNNPICTSANTPYYTETFFHLAMMDMDPLITYIVQYYEAEGEDMSDPNNTYNKCLNIVNDILAEMTRVAGYADRKPISTPINWNGNYVLSGMYAGGRNLWRLTPNTAVKSLADFKVAGDDPTFSIDGLTITFPGGRIIETGDVRTAGTCGYWIETAADVTPTITSEADRYSKYPSFVENFSGSALNSGHWSVSTGLFGTDPSVQNGALSLTGDGFTATTVTNVKVPQNITAGDSFAKQQAWEVSFTLPSGLGTSAEIKLLTANGDGGFRIKGVTAYYDQNGSYQKMNIPTFSTGTKYTLKREVDFTKAGQYTSNYYVYDANGNLVGEVKNVPMKNISLPVTSIGFSAKSLSSRVVKIDDYKLYPMGVTTDFEVYDTALGYKQDASQVRTEDTAYRLSWMNTSDDDLLAHIKNAQTGAIVKTVWMAAGQDGVATGIVEANGSNIQLYVETTDISGTELQNAPWIAFGSEDTAKTPIEGGNSIFFKTSANGTVTEGGSEGDYNIKISYALGGKATITLNNATITSDYAGINFGKDASSTERHKYPVEIIVKGNNTITTTNGAAAIMSYADADLTIKSEANGRLDIFCDLQPGVDTKAAIYSQGNINLDKANIFIQGTNASGEAGSFVCSENGDITINSGSLQIATGGFGLPVAGNNAVLSAKGDIMLKGAVKLTVWNKGTNSVFSAMKVYVKDAVMKVVASHADGRIVDAQTKLVFPNYNSAASATMPTATFSPTTGITITPPEFSNGFDENESDGYKYFSISPA